MYKVDVFLEQSFNFADMLSIHTLHSYMFVIMFVSTIFNEGAYALMWHSQSSIRPSNMVFWLFENVETLESASVYRLMLSAKQVNYW